LSWSASAGATSYTLYRSTSSGSETSLVSGLTSTSYVDSSVSSGTTYYYTVAAVNSSGTSGYSNEASATPQSGLPSPPTNLTATGGNDEVTLAWTASTGATSYNVYRGTLTGQETVTVATGVTTTSYVDSTVTNGPTYYYKVTATNSAGTSGYSNEASAATSAGNPPTAPAGLSATAGNTQISLSWTASSGATSYTLYRGTSSGSETSLISGLTSTTYTNTGLTNGTTYYYKVTATNTAGTSAYSNEASATPTSGGGGTTTYYQDSFSRTGDVTGSTPDVTDTGGATWSNSNGTGEYPISGGTASINPSAYSWSAEYLPVNGSSGVTVDGTKNFTLSVVVTPAAVSSARTGISLNTAVPGSLYSSDFAAMSTCSGFAGAYAFNGGTINYNYAAGISGATTISISYSASAGTVTYQVGSTTLYTQTGVTAAQVAAIRYITLGDDGYGNGDATPAPTFDNFTFTVGSGSGGSAPLSPTGLTATAGNAQVSLSWTASSGATSYSVYRSTTSGSETLLTGSVSGTTYSDTSVTNGTAYYYKVTATNSSGTSGYSNEASATPSAGSPPPAPTGLTATAGNTQVSLSWTASSGATSYTLYRGTSSGSETLLTGSLSGTTYTDTGLTNGTAYCYKVTATNSAGTSGYSNEASATPTSGGGGTTTYYQDSFSRTGDMTGSTPDVTNTGGATWANQAGTGQYPISGGTASIAPSAYSWSAEYLPVNGTSGVTVDGTKNFTLSVVVTPAAVSSARTGISLNTAAPGNLYTSDFAAMSTCSGFAGAYAFNGGTINYNYAAGISGATTVSISYSASAGTVTYQVGSTTLYTQTGVTAAQVAAIRYITLGDDGYGGGDATPAPTFDNFTFTVGSGGGSAPPAPTGLTATAGNAQVSLSWTASSGATSYSVYRSTTSGSETLLTGGVSGTSYTDTSVTNGTAYYYKVTATNSSGTSGYSNEANATPSAGSPPTAPSGLTATAGNTQISLSWTASSGATSYTLYRGTSSGSETSLVSGLTSTTYTNTSLTNGTAYYYKVTATNSAGTSGYSNEASATPTSGGGATTYYQDSFSRTGDITGSTPDVTNTGGATWANQAGTGQYPISGGTASIAPSAYSWSAEYLPVNGSSGVTLDGTKNFTLSVVVTPAAVSSARTGISLNTAVPGNLYTSDFAAMSTCSGFAGAYAFNGGNINYNYAAGITGATTISISYSASAGTVTYQVGSTTLYTQTGVTAAQVAAIRYITLGDDGYGGGDATPAPTFDNFTLTVGP
jgi:fibronectin type 3 domain-containing protein